MRNLLGVKSSAMRLNFLHVGMAAAAAAWVGLVGCAGVAPAARTTPAATAPVLGTTRSIAVKPKSTPLISQGFVAAPEAAESVFAGAADLTTLDVTPSTTGVELQRELERGSASWYGPGFHGKRTANGERYDMHALTAAHKTLPFGTMVRVKSLVNGREVLVRITDRGPFIRNRVIDLSRAAASELGMLSLGFKQVVLLVGEAEVGDKPAAVIKRRLGR